jgi:hypothetical protein
MSAVSKKLMPSSRARSMILKLSSWVVRQPKFMVTFDLTL